MIGNIISKLIIGILSDSFGALKASIVMIMANIAGIMLLLIAANTWMLIIGALLFGALFSVGSVGVALLTKHFFSLENYTTTYPVVSFVGGLGVAVALSLVGYIYDFTGSYTTTFMIALVCHGISMILLIITVIKSQHASKMNVSVKKSLKGTT